jgi:hypothetical protein
MKNKFWTTLALSFLLLPLCAQDTPTKGFTLPGLKGFDVKFGGYGMLLYQYNEAATPVNHNFAPRVAFLWAEAKVTDHLRFTVMHEAVSAKMYEYWAEWMPSTAFRLRAGQYKIPFTMETPISLTVLESVNYSRTVQALGGYGTDVLAGNNGGGRDIGIQAAGDLIPGSDHSYLHYAAGVFQGAGFNRGDNNNAKDFIGTLTVEPIKGWRVAGGAYIGKFPYVDGVASPNAAASAKDETRNRFALSSDFTSGRFYARAEWINGKDAAINKEGVYGTASYFLVPSKLNAFVKAEHFNRNKDAKETATDYTVGLNYHITGTCRLQFNYQYSDYSEQWGSKDGSLVLAEFQIVF